MTHHTTTLPPVSPLPPHSPHNTLNTNYQPTDPQVTLSEDVNGAASKLISLKAEFPKADIFSIMAARPKTLLQSEATLLENARKVGVGWKCVLLWCSSVVCGGM